MKKWICIALCAGMMFGAAACGGGAEETSAEAQQVQQTEEADIAEETETDTRGIDGSNYYKVCYAMMQNGFPEFEKSYIPEEDLYLVPYSQLYDEVTYTYGLSYIGGGEIIDASFSVANTDDLDSKAFLEKTQVFMDFCATIPYDTMDTEKLQSWIGENLAAVGSEEDGVETVVGDVEYSLYRVNNDNGVPTSRTLYMQKATK